MVVMGDVRLKGASIWCFFPLVAPWSDRASVAPSRPFLTIDVQAHARSKRFVDSLTR